MGKNCLGKGYFPIHAFIFWLALKNRLQVKSRLFKWRLVDNAVCPLCSVDDENIPHLYFNCSFTKSLWWMIMSKVDICRDPYQWRREIS